MSPTTGTPQATPGSGSSWPAPAIPLPRWHTSWHAGPGRTGSARRRSPHRHRCPADQPRRPGRGRAAAGRRRGRRRHGGHPPGGHGAGRPTPAPGQPVGSRPDGRPGLGPRHPAALTPSGFTQRTSHVRAHRTVQSVVLPRITHHHRGWCRRDDPSRRRRVLLGRGTNQAPPEASAQSPCHCRAARRSSGVNGILSGPGMRSPGRGGHEPGGDCTAEEMGGYDFRAGPRDP
jgi:hypothetical protein